jgi:hypothetical protein
MIGSISDQSNLKARSLELRKAISVPDRRKGLTSDCTHG